MIFIPKNVLPKLSRNPILSSLIEAAVASPFPFERPSGLSSVFNKNGMMDEIKAAFITPFPA
ncbi:hypothetical protein D3C85_1403600 [compost metagenome]